MLLLATVGHVGPKPNESSIPIVELKRILTFVPHAACKIVNILFEFSMIF